MSAARLAPWSSCVNMISQGTGTRVPGPEHPQRNAITANLLSKSGLTGSRVERDLNLLEYGVGEAAHCLREDNLKGVLGTHFGLNNLDPDTRKKQADGCNIGSLLIMNAAMLHPSIAAGQWLSGISEVSQLKNEENVVSNLSLAWERIIGHDFHLVLAPALEAVHAVQTAGKPDGLAQARHVGGGAAEAIAHACADPEVDHAGQLPNKVEDRNQALAGSAPQAMAALRNLTISVMRWAGENNIDAALRRRSIRP